jgi:hypothetical protein
MTMHRKLALTLVTATAALGMSVAVAGPASARNVGGSLPEGSVCVTPGAPVYRSPNAWTNIPCVCVLTPDGSRRNVGGTGPREADCPPGLLKLVDDRNVGG